MDFSIYFNGNSIIIPVSDSKLYEYNMNCCNWSKSTRQTNASRYRTSSEKRNRSRDEDKQNKENQKKKSGRCTTFKQTYTSRERLLSVCQ